MRLLISCSTILHTGFGFVHPERMCSMYSLSSAAHALPLFVLVVPILYSGMFVG